MKISCRIVMSFLIMMNVSIIMFMSTNQMAAGDERITHELYRPFNNTISAVFVFGDSTVDPGNNNFITKTIFKSNFAPYGKDFIAHIPTGRFSNGRLVPDFIISYIGVKETVPPYLDSELSLEELLTGVSFASAGTGLDPYTAEISSVLSLPEQLNYFREYKTRIKEAVGEEEGNLVISKSVFLLSVGTNDFIVNYLGISPQQRITYTIAAYHFFLLQNMQKTIQDLVEEGANKIAVVGLTPMGCLPIVITFFGAHGVIGERQCVDKISQLARDYNQQLQMLIKALSIQYPTTTIIYVNVYDLLNDMIHDPDKYGFEDVNSGCCGSGLVEGAFLCNPTTCYVCPDASRKVFWDAIHPSQQTYFNLFKSFRPLIADLIKE